MPILFKLPQSVFLLNNSSLHVFSSMWILHANTLNSNSSKVILTGFTFKVDSQMILSYVVAE